jgi:hypothetical protein
MSAEKYDPYDFANRRHIGPSPEEIAEMLRVVGASTLDVLIAETVPENIRAVKALDFGRPLSERGALDRLRETADKNRVLTSLIGQGYHGTIMPPAIQRNILENPAWYTALHALPARNQPGPTGGDAQFPDSRPRSYRARHRQCFAARRGDGGGGGDGARRACDEIHDDDVLHR